MSEPETKVSFSEAPAVGLPRLIREAGLVPASQAGKPLELTDSAHAYVNILRERTEAPVHPAPKLLLGFIPWPSGTAPEAPKHEAIGQIEFFHSDRNWKLLVYGRQNVDAMMDLARKCSATYDRQVDVVLERELAQTPLLSFGAGDLEHGIY